MIKVVRSDRSGEYDAPFDLSCSKHGIIHQTTAPYSPPSNGVAQLKTKTLKEMMNTMLIIFGLSPNMWEEALLSVKLLLNKMPHKKNSLTPYKFTER